MRTWENIKTVLLTFLIFMSLLLTLVLWNYQPEYDWLDDGTQYVHETKLDGKELAFKNVLSPLKVVLHQNNQHSSLLSASDQLGFYKKMSEWTLTNWTVLSDREIVLQADRLELVLPEEIPYSMIESLFVVENRRDIPKNGSFSRIVFSIGDYQKNIYISFVPETGNNRLRAQILNANVMDVINDFISASMNNMDFMLFETRKGFPIYLPNGEVDLTKYTYSTNRLDVQPLVNVLFSDPKLVRQSLSSDGEMYYTDGTRGMEVSQNDRYIEFINPPTSDFRELNKEDLITQSIDFMNDHAGWTDEYKLFSIDESTNTINYRLFVKEYPVFDYDNLAVIEQTWRDREIYQYRRPMIELATTFESSETTTLRSGQSVIEYLEQNQERYSTELIYDIAIGYFMQQRADFSYIVSLEPSWFINYDGTWQRLTFVSDSIQMQGGSGNAVGTN
ncbi:two-component system activity regulator YycH [Bacillaceae bacterium S4-13-56]